MNKALNVLMVWCFCMQQLVAQTIPNGDFEYWDFTSNPGATKRLIGWTINQTLFNNPHIERSDMAQHGNYCVAIMPTFDFGSIKCEFYADTISRYLNFYMRSWLSPTDSIYIAVACKNKQSFELKNIRITSRIDNREWAPFYIDLKTLNQPDIEKIILFIAVGGNLPHFYIDHLTFSHIPTGARFGDSASTSSPSIYSSIEIKIFPNPFTNQVFFECKKTIESIEIYNQYGQMVQTLPPKSQSADLSNLPMGIYYIKIIDETGSQITQLIKAASQ